MWQSKLGAGAGGAAADDADDEVTDGAVAADAAMLLLSETSLPLLPPSPLSELLEDEEAEDMSDPREGGKRGQASGGDNRLWCEEINCAFHNKQANKSKKMYTNEHRWAEDVGQRGKSC
jgi:hypothetical protein